MMTEREELLVNTIGGRFMDTYDEFIDSLWEIFDLSTEEQVQERLFEKIKELKQQKDLEWSQSIEFINEVTADTATK